MMVPASAVPVSVMVHTHMIKELCLLLHPYDIFPPPKTKLAEFSAILSYTLLWAVQKEKEAAEYL